MNKSKSAHYKKAMYGWRVILGMHYKNDIKLDL